MDDKVEKLIKLYETILHGTNDKMGLFDCYDTYYKGCWDEELKEVEYLKKKVRKQLVKKYSISDVRLSFVDWVEENYPTLKNHGDSLTLSELKTAYKQYTNEA